MGIPWDSVHLNAWTPTLNPPIIIGTFSTHEKQNRLRPVFKQDPFPDDSGRGVVVGRCRQPVALPVDVVSLHPYD